VDDVEAEFFEVGEEVLVAGREVDGAIHAG
jgi:hypothetical protein